FRYRRRRELFSATVLPVLRTAPAQKQMSRSQAREKQRFLTRYALFQSCPDRHVLQKACQNWFTAFQRRREQHAVRFESPHLARGEVRDDYDLATNQSLRCVCFGNSG